MEVLLKRWHQELKAWERGVRVMEEQGCSRAGKNKDKPQSSRKSDLISFIANTVSCYASGSGSPDRSCSAALGPFIFCPAVERTGEVPAMGM